MIKETMKMWKIKCLDMFNVPPLLLKEKRKGDEVKWNKRNKF